MPAAVRVDVDTSELGSTGRAVAAFTFTVDAPVARALGVRLLLRAGGDEILRRDHEPPVPTLAWEKDQVVRYEIPLFFPIRPKLPAGETAVSLFVGFIDPSTQKLVPPVGARRSRDGSVFVGEFEFPPDGSDADLAAIDAVIASAREAASAGRPAEAWDTLEFVFRRISDYPAKARLRDALAEVGRFAPPAMTFEEEAIVANRIGAERRRYLRQVAGRLYDRGELHGALVLLDAIGGALREDADRAVLGALRDAERVTKDRDDIAKKIIEAITDVEKAEVKELRSKHGDTKRALEHALKLAKSPKRRAVARALLKELGFAIDDAVAEPAKQARADLEVGWLADVPADQRRHADEALNHPCWGRTKSRVSHRFVLIGPKNLIDAIPDDSTLRFDLAYVYLTDLFGRVPNPAGDRVTVYFKELWEFGGGVGGGKIIDVGRADPNDRKVRVDTGLLFHELTHCVDDTTPVYAGFREGLADFGAAFSHSELGDRAQARLRIGNCLRAFHEDYVSRDLEYWRIPNYGPSAGFLMHFLTTYGKADGGGHRWDLYRRFFRAFRECQVKDGRTPTIARAFAHHLVEVFGQDAFADLQRFRWPLVDSDLDAIATEHDAAEDGRSAFEGDFERFAGSPVPRDLRATALVRARGAEPGDFEQDLGVIRNWQVIGPFKREGTNPDSFVFPPEREVVLDARYTVPNHTATWRKPGPKPVTVDATGWLRYQFAYQNDTAIYALSHVHVDEGTDAFIHVRTDDDVTVFLNDELVGKHGFGSGPVGPWRPGGRVLLPDAIRFRVRLAAGRNKLLIKTRNRTGGSGCIAAISKLDGMPLERWSSDDLPPERATTEIEVPDPRKWGQRFAVGFNRSGAQRKLETTVGEFRVSRKALEGRATDRGVQWRKYTVRPGFPKDSPSNLAWVPKKATKDLDAFWLSLGLDREAGPPKLCLIFQGDGGRDALPGWTLILEPRRERVRARLERYDRLVYESDWIEFAEGDAPLALELHYFARRLTVSLGDQTLLEQVPLRPIPGAERIGLSTWGPQTRITELRLRAPARTR